MVSPGDAAANVLFCCCGPKGSLCCFVLSIWGFIMLAILGGLFQVRAVGLYEDIESGLSKFSNDSITGEVPYSVYTASNVDSVYQDAAASCYGAAVIYLIFIGISGAFIGINIWRSKLKQE